MKKDNDMKVAVYMRVGSKEQLDGGKAETGNNLIPLKDYAEMNGISDSTLRHRIRNGVMPEAVKLAGSWFVPRDLPLIDHRTKGNSKRWAKDESTD